MYATPGMTEFPLGEKWKLGIMPGDGIVKILDNQVENPYEIVGMPRCEIYLYMDDPDHGYDQALKAGGQAISSGAIWNWGDYAAYCSDYDGNIIVFAKQMK